MQESAAGQLPRADEVSEVLREILAGPEFVAFEEGARWLLLLWLGDLLADLWHWVRQLVGEQTGAAEILTILIVVAAAVVLVLVTARHAPAWLRRGEQEDHQAPPETPVSAGEWLRLATERAGRGELRPAATALYQGFLLTLEKGGVLSFHNSKTPGDYALEIARGGGVAGAGGRFLDSFQDFSFGPEVPTTERYAGLARRARDAGCGTREEGEAAQPYAASAGGDADAAAGDGDCGTGAREPEADPK